MPNSPTQRYTFPQLEQLWINAGGDRASAAVMAAIALAESGGNPGATNHNSDGSTDRGLWQINSVHGSQSTYDITGNAQAAVAIKKSQGLSAWTTYTSGAYRQFMSSAAPDPNLPGGSTSVGGGTNATQAGLSDDLGNAIGSGFAAAFQALFQPIISTVIWGGEILFGTGLMVVAVIIFVMATKTGQRITGTALGLAKNAVPEVGLPLKVASGAKPDLITPEQKIQVEQRRQAERKAIRTEAARRNKEAEKRGKRESGNSQG